jgi:hypothetical protein
MLFLERLTNRLYIYPGSSPNDLQTDTTYSVWAFKDGQNRCFFLVIAASVVTTVSRIQFAPQCEIALLFIEGLEPSKQNEGLIRATTINNKFSE